MDTYQVSQNGVAVGQLAARSQGEALFRMVAADRVRGGRVMVEPYRSPADAGAAPEGIRPGAGASGRPVRWA